MGYLEQAVLARNPVFRDRVRVAAVTAAEQIGGESQGDMTVAVYEKRQRLAASINSTGGEGQVGVFAWGVAANPVITMDSSDSDIQFTVNSIWSDVAEVTALDAVPPP